MELFTAGITQAELARALGVSRPTIARYECGTRSLPIGALIQIGHVLAVPVAGPGRTAPARAAGH